MKSLIEIKNLSLSTQNQELIHSLSLEIHRGEILGFVGESGSGKTLTGKSIARINDENIFKYDGVINYEGENLLSWGSKKIRDFHRHDIAMIFQNPMNSLNPLSKVKTQLIESIRMVQSVSPKEAHIEAENLLFKSGFEKKLIPKVMDSYSFELSGGMQQRVMIAIAIAKKPKLLIADEPTTALDVTTQEKIIHLLAHLNQEDGLSILFITHDLSVAQQLCHRIAVLKDGKLLEIAKTKDLFTQPTNPYTLKLISSVPGLSDDQYNHLEQLKKRADNFRKKISQQPNHWVEVQPEHWARI